MAEVAIYGLFDPITGECRYVGQSVAPRNRFSAHVRGAINGRTHKDNWIRSVGQPLLCIFDVVWADEADDVERSWIESLPNLTNVSEGGGGIRGWKAPTETRDRMAAAAKARCADPSERERMRSISNGQPPRMCGSENPLARLTEDGVARLRREVRSGADLGELSAELGVSRQAAWMAVTGLTWRHVAEEPITSGKRQRLTDEDVNEIRRLANSGEKQLEIARLYGIDASHVSKITSGTRRRVLAN